MQRALPVVVIGAGQAGLSAGHHLQRAGIEHVILDQEERPGGAWQHRWKSLTVGETNGIHNLPEAPFGEEESRPAREAVPEYFAKYEDEQKLAILRPIRVQRVERDGAHLHVTGENLGTSEKYTFETEHLINATGTWSRPHWPKYPGQETYQGAQHHTSTYPGREWYQGKRVLVVGGGFSAVGFLLELEGVAETTWVTRTPPRWRERLEENELRAAVAEIAERAARGEAIGSIVSATGIGLTPELAAAKKRGVLAAEPIFDRITATGAQWADGHTRTYDAILWCTGFRYSLNHLAPLQLRERGGGIKLDGTKAVREPRVHLLGYGPSASTVGATRAARDAVREIRKELRKPGGPEPTKSNEKPKEAS